MEYHHWQLHAYSGEHSYCLQTVTCDIECKPTQAHTNADGLSRLPLPQVEKSEVPIRVDVLNVAQLTLSQ